MNQIKNLFQDPQRLFSVLFYAVFVLVFLSFQIRYLGHDSVRTAPNFVVPNKIYLLEYFFRGIFIIITAWLVLLCGIKNLKLSLLILATLFYLNNIFRFGFEQGTILMALGLWANASVAGLLYQQSFKFKLGMGHQLFIFIFSSYFCIIGFYADLYRHSIPYVNPNFLSFLMISFLLIQFNSNHLLKGLTKWTLINTTVLIFSIAMLESRAGCFALLLISIAFLVVRTSWFYAIQLIMAVGACVYAFGSRGDFIAQQIEGRIWMFVDRITNQLGIGSPVTEIVNVHPQHGLRDISVPSTSPASKDESMFEVILDAVNEFINGVIVYIDVVIGQGFGVATNAAFTWNILMPDWSVYRISTADSTLASIFSNGGLILFIAILYLVLKDFRLPKKTFELFSRRYISSGLILGSLLVFCLGQPILDAYYAAFLFFFGVATFIQNRMEEK